MHADDAESRAALHLAQALEALGLVDDPELAQTPAQVAELLAGFRPQAPPPCTALPTASHDLVVLRDLPFHSLCAHHLLPFFGTCTIAYLPNGKVGGLGWFPRLLEAHARRPQLQERLAAQVADGVMAALSPGCVGVRVVARQLCVEMRGARSAGRFEVTAIRGVPDRSLEQALSRG